MARLLLAQTEEPRTPGAQEPRSHGGNVAPWLLGLLGSVAPRLPPRSQGAKESWGERGSMAPWLLARGVPEEARSQGGKESKESWAAWLLGSVVPGPERAGGAKDVK